VFDICHGCRRCFSLCNAFPVLFDAVDASPSGELDGVDRKVFWEVVDHCYLCDMCFMTKCPYVPPHQFDLDFPHLMLRAKAIKFKRGDVKFRDKLLSSTDAVGKLASIPVVVQAVNAVNNTAVTRRLMHDHLGIHKDRELPRYTSRTFKRSAEPDATFPVVAGERTPGKVAVYSTCYINYNEPGIGHDLLGILRHNRIPARVLTGEACCGMPKLELGDLDSVQELKSRNIPVLARYAADGYAIVTPIPSCTLMYKQELPLLFPDDPEVARVAQAMYDPFEYLSLRHADRLLSTDFRAAIGKVAYHIPCHQRVQNFGQRTREVLELVPGTTVSVVERCSGHDGTWGVKTEFFEASMKIGKPVFRQMAAANADWVVSDCPIATRHIKQGMEGKGGAPSHPLTLLCRAYGTD